MDPSSESILDLVNPQLATAIRRLSVILADEFKIKVIRGLASWNDQRKVYQQGRDLLGNVIDPSKVVTNAPPGHSWHNFGMAVDVCPVPLLTLHNWGVGDPRWTRMVQAAESLGLYSGSHFVHPEPDWPHLQLTGNFGVSPDDEVRQTFLEGGTIAVWNAAGLVDDDDTRNA